MDITKKRIIYIDLDGTLITTASGDVFPVGVYDMEIKLDTLSALKKLYLMHPYDNFYVFVVTNQGGIQMGFVNQNRFMRKAGYVTACIKDYLEPIVENKRLVVEYYFATTTKPEDKFRKPNRGMFDLCNSLYLLDEEGELTKEDTEAMLMVGDSSGKDGKADTDFAFACNCGIDFMDVEDFVLI